jgi:hypothetical protein
LKEAFDITYAVHRMEEEGARRRGRAGGAAAVRNWLGGLNEDDEYEQVDAGTAPATTEPRKEERSRTGQRDRSRRAGEGGGLRGQFELDLEGATLLGRRGQKRAGAGVGSPLAAGVKGAPEGLGSPMRMG